MNALVSVTGYTPHVLRFCVECGSENNYQAEGGALFVCEECGLQCYIVEGDGSHGGTCHD